MSTSFPGFFGPTVGTEVPLEMLAACHIRIERQCSTLRRLAVHLAKHGANDEARRAAVNIMRYFDTSALQHHQDEEDNLFPALLESMAGSDPVCLREMTQGLTEDHRKLESMWHHLRQALGKVVAGEPALLPTDEIEAFVGLYERHTKLEEDELFPMAARLLSDAELDRIGHAMRVRRGIQNV
ncbi:MAG TPA: hemerythrin domain-containing protein [Eoetvoesiella sp.]